MTIKNWFVRSERIKDKHGGLIKYGKYLVNMEHANHKNTESIIHVYGNIENFIRTCSNEAVSLDLENSQKREGVLSRVTLKVLFSVFRQVSLNQHQTNGNL